MNLVLVVFHCIYFPCVLNFKQLEYEAKEPWKDGDESENDERDQV